MNTSIGNNIKNARKKMGLTQEELAFQLGVTAQAVSRWESEVGLPDISMIIPLAQALSVSTDTLFGLSEHSYDAMHYEEVGNTIHQNYQGLPKAENALKAVRYVQEEITKDPANYPLLSLLVEMTANLSRFVDLEGRFLDEWPDIRKNAIRAGLQVIRHSGDIRTIEKTHFALAWIYIHEKDYTSAREHIQALPSVASNRLQESILAELAFFENGIEAEKEVVRSNLQNFTRAINKEFTYAMETSYWYAPWEDTVAFGKWGLHVINALAENPDMLSFCRGFTRECYLYLIGAYIKGGKYEEAAESFRELKKCIEHHYYHYQKVLADENERKKYTAGNDSSNLQFMKDYTLEFIQEKQTEILQLLKSWNNEEIFAQFEKLL